MNAQQIFSHVAQSLEAINTRLNGVSKDVEGMRNPRSAFFFSEHTAKYLAQTRTDIGLVFPVSGAVNPKAPKRFTQFVNALQVAEYKNIDLTTARALVALREAGGTLHRDALFNLLTGKVKTEGVSPNTKGVGATRLDSLLGRVGKDSVETQLSRSFGANGFCRALGMVSVSGAVNFSVTVNPENLFVKRFYSLIDSATAAQLEELGGKGKSEE